MIASAPAIVIVAAVWLAAAVLAVAQALHDVRVVRPLCPPESPLLRWAIIGPYRIHWSLVLASFALFTIESPLLIVLRMLDSAPGATTTAMLMVLCARHGLMTRSEAYRRWRTLGLPDDAWDAAERAVERVLGRTRGPDE